MTRAEELEVGRERAERIAELLGWQLNGYGYPGDGASFRDESRQPLGYGCRQIEGAVIDALLAAIDSGRIVVVRR